MHVYLLSEKSGGHKENR